MVKNKFVVYGFRQFHCIHKTNNIYKDVEMLKLDLILQIMNYVDHRLKKT